MRCVRFFPLRLRQRHLPCLFQGAMGISMHLFIGQRTVRGIEPHSLGSGANLTQLLRHCPLSYSPRGPFPPFQDIILSVQFLNDRNRRHAFCRCRRIPGQCAALACYNIDPWCRFIGDIQTIVGLAHRERLPARECFAFLLRGRPWPVGRGE